MWRFKRGLKRLRRLIGLRRWVFVPILAPVSSPCEEQGLRGSICSMSSKGWHFVPLLAPVSNRCL